MKRIIFGALLAGLFAVSLPAHAYGFYPYSSPYSSSPYSGCSYAGGWYFTAPAYGYGSGPCQQYQPVYPSSYQQTYFVPAYRPTYTYYSFYSQPVYVAPTYSYGYGYDNYYYDYPYWGW